MLVMWITYPHPRYQLLLPWLTSQKLVPGLQCGLRRGELVLDNEDLTPLNAGYCIMYDRQRGVYYIHRKASILAVS